MENIIRKTFSRTKTIRRFIAFKAWFFSWGWLAILIGTILSLAMFMVLGVQLAFQDNSVGTGSDFGEITGGRLSEATLAWQGDVEAELSRQGLDPNEWTILTLGIIETESGGNADVLPDIMQASESQGQGMNTITDPLESIRVGVTALSNAISVAEGYGITDKKAILQAYNFNTGFLSAMHSANKKEFDIDFAQNYSKTVVYPAVTGADPSTATKVPYENPWSQEVGMPWRWYNGGNFHYPNIVYYYISGASGGAVDFDGSFAIPFNSSYVVTSEFGYRIHPITQEYKYHAGIDVVGQGDKTIRSIAAGTVVQSAFNAGGWGNYVVVDHGVENGKQYYSLYAHMSSSGVKAGTKVSQGAILGKEGETGGAKGVHLHLEIIQTTPGGSWAGAPRINPREVISFN